MTTSPWHTRAIRRLGLSGVIAAALLCLLLGVAVLGPWLLNTDPYKGDLRATFVGPTGDHWFGTDGSGRDLFVRMVHGARTSVVAGVIAVATSVALGVPAGLISGYLTNVIGASIRRIFDSIQSVPPLILALALVAVLGSGLEYAMLAVGVVYAPRCFRVTRAATLETKATTFIEAQRALGIPQWRIVVGHILPNVLSPLIVVVAISFGTAVLAEASLSFLGVGVSAPTASWGQMLQTAFQRADLLYLAIPPGVAILVTVASFIVLGDRLRDALMSADNGTK